MSEYCLSKNDSRYPYTYSADWIRLCGLAESRSDAAEWAKLYCAKHGIDLESFKASCADQYISYFNDLNAVETRPLKWRKELLAQPLTL